MSKNELSFETFLKSHNVNYVIPEKGNFSITNVAFNKNGIYKPDFYLSNKQLHDLSYKRLSEYICTRQEEYKTWLRTL